MSFWDYFKTSDPYDIPDSQYSKALMNLSLQQQQMMAYPPRYSVNKDAFSQGSYTAGVAVGGGSGGSYLRPRDIEIYQKHVMSMAPWMNGCQCNDCQFRIDREMRMDYMAADGMKVMSTPLGTNSLYEEYKKTGVFKEEGEFKDVPPLDTDPGFRERIYAKKIRKLFWARKDKLLDKKKKTT